LNIQPVETAYICGEDWFVDAFRDNIIYGIYGGRAIPLD